jgi:hypothetical protein
VPERVELPGGDLVASELVLGQEDRCYGCLLLDGGKELPDDDNPWGQHKEQSNGKQIHATILFGWSSRTSYISRIGLPPRDG